MKRKKSNFLMWKRVQRFSIRKFNVGIASVMVGSALLFMGSNAQAQGVESVQSATATSVPADKADDEIAHSATSASVDKVDDEIAQPAAAATSAVTTETVSADKTALNLALQAAKTVQVATSNPAKLQAFQAAFESAQKVADKADASQAEVDQVLALLLASQKELEMAPVTKEEVKVEKSVAEEKKAPKEEIKKTEIPVSSIKEVAKEETGVTETLVSSTRETVNDEAKAEEDVSAEKASLKLVTSSDVVAKETVNKEILAKEVNPTVSPVSIEETLLVAWSALNKEERRKKALPTEGEKYTAHGANLRNVGGGITPTIVASGPGKGQWADADINTLKNGILAADQAVGSSGDKYNGGTYLYVRKHKDNNTQLPLSETYKEIYENVTLSPDGGSFVWKIRNLGTNSEYHQNPRFYYTIPTGLKETKWNADFSLWNSIKNQYLTYSYSNWKELETGKATGADTNGHKTGRPTDQIFNAQNLNSGKTLKNTMMKYDQASSNTDDYYQPADRHTGNVGKEQELFDKMVASTGLVHEYVIPSKQSGAIGGGNSNRKKTLNFIFETPLNNSISGKQLYAFVGMQSYEFSINRNYMQLMHLPKVFRPADPELTIAPASDIVAIKARDATPNASTEAHRGTTDQMTITYTPQNATAEKTVTINRFENGDWSLSDADHRAGITANGKFLNVQGKRGTAVKAIAKNHAGNMTSDLVQLSIPTLTNVGAPRVKPDDDGNVDVNPGPGISPDEITIKYTPRNSTQEKTVVIPKQNGRYVVPTDSGITQDVTLTRTGGFVVPAKYGTVVTAIARAGNDTATNSARAIEKVAPVIPNQTKQTLTKGTPVDFVLAPPTDDNSGVNTNTWEITNLPEGLMFDKATGRVSGTLADDVIAGLNRTIVSRVEDNAGNVGTKSFQWDIKPKAPTITKELAGQAGKTPDITVQGQPGETIALYAGNEKIGEKVVPERAENADPNTPAVVTITPTRALVAGESVTAKAVANNAESIPSAAKVVTAPQNMNITAPTNIVQAADKYLDEKEKTEIKRQYKALNSSLALEDSNITITDAGAITITKDGYNDYTATADPKTNTITRFAHIRNDYNIVYDENNKKVRPTDEGLSRTTDGKALIYKYDATNGSGININDVLKLLKATPKNPSVFGLSEIPGNAKFDENPAYGLREQGGSNTSLFGGTWYKDNKTTSVLDLVSAGNFDRINGDGNYFDPSPRVEKFVGGKTVGNSDVKLVESGHSGGGTGTTLQTANVPAENGGAAFTINNVANGLPAMYRSQLYLTGSGNVINMLQYRHNTNNPDAPAKATDNVMNIYFVPVDPVKPVITSKNLGTQASPLKLDLANVPALIAANDPNIKATDNYNNDTTMKSKLNVKAYIEGKENAPVDVVVNGQEVANKLRDIASANPGKTITLKATAADQSGNKADEVIAGVLTTPTDAEKSPLTNPAVTKVTNPTALTPDEIQAVKDAVKTANPSLSDDQIGVDNTGKVTVTYPDSSTNEIPASNTVAEKTQAEKSPLTNPAVTKVTNPTALTPDEIQAVKDAVKTANPSLSDAQIGVDNTGKVTVTYPDSSVNEIPASNTVAEKTQAEKVEPTIPTTPTKVVDTNNLTKDEKDQVAKKVEDANQDKFPAGTKVEVGNDGTATITYPDGSKDTIPGTDLVTTKPETGTTADKVEPTVPTTPAKVADTNNLTKEEKEQVVKNVEDANQDKFPEGTKVEVGNDGTATITYPDQSKDTIPGTDLVTPKPETGTTADKVEPTVPTTPAKVADTNNLTKEEKDQVAKNVADANQDKFPEGTKVEVGNDGTATITYPDQSKDTIPGTDLVTMPGKNSVNKPAEKTPVQDPANLTDAEKEAVKKEVEKVNPGKTVEVDDKGNATVTDPKTGNSVVISGKDLVVLDPTTKEDAKKVVDDAAKAKKDEIDKGNLSDIEKEKAKAEVDKKVKEAKDAIDSSETKSDLDKAIENAKKEISEVPSSKEAEDELDKFKEDAKKVVDDAAKVKKDDIDRLLEEAKKEVDANDQLTADQKVELKNKLDKAAEKAKKVIDGAAEKAKKAIDIAGTKSDVTKAKDTGIQEISQVGLAIHGEPIVVEKPEYPLSTSVVEKPKYPLPTLQDDETDVHGDSSSDQTKSNQENDSKKLPNTGTTTSVASLVAALFASLSGFGLFAKKRKEE